MMEYARRMEPVNEIDRLMFYDSQALAKFLKEKYTATIAKLMAVYPWEMRVETVAELAGDMQMNVEYLILLILEIYTIQLTEANFGHPNRHMHIRENLNIRENIMRVSPISQGFLEDVQSVGRRKLKASNAYRGKEGESFSIGL